MNATPEMEAKLAALCSKGHLTPRTEKNQYLKVSYRGADGLVTSKWNIKIYTSGSVVCNDPGTLEQLLNGSLREPDDKLKLLQIDDAGTGFPLCGIMIGVTDGRSLWTEIIDVIYFQGERFEKKLYTDQYALAGLRILKRLGAAPQTHRIEICTGFINTKLRDILRNRGYDVRVTDIKGLLQDQLEDRFRDYVRGTLTVDLAFDPKKIGKERIPPAFRRAVSWGKRHAPKMLKTGWNI